MTKLNYNWTSATTTTSTYNPERISRPLRYFTPKIWDSHSSGSTYTHLNSKPGGAGAPLIDVYDLTPEVTNSRYLENNCIKNTGELSNFLDYEFKDEFSIKIDGKYNNRTLDMTKIKTFLNKLDFSYDNKNRAVSRLDNASKKWALYSLPGHGAYFNLTDVPTIRSNIFPKQSASIESVDSVGNKLLINNTKVMSSCTGVKNFEPITVDNSNPQDRERAPRYQP